MPKNSDDSPKAPYALFVHKSLRVRTFFDEDEWRDACNATSRKLGDNSFEALKYNSTLGGYYKLEQY